MPDPKLSDTQLLILNSAARRDNRALLPISKSVTAKGGALTASLKSLRDRGLANEIEGVSPKQTWRSDDDGRATGLAISEAGLKSIGLGEMDSAGPRPKKLQTNPRQAGCKVEAPRDGTKTARLVSLLSVQKGATIEVIVKKLGWQDHTVRAAMTGLRKRGYAIKRDKRADGTTIYRITEEAAQ